MIRKIIDKVTDFGFLVLMSALFFSGMGLYFWNYSKSPEDTAAVTAFNILRAENPDAAKRRFHNMMGPCVEQIMGETITGRHKAYFADMFYVLSDPAVSFSISKGYDRIGEVEQVYKDIFLSQSMVPTPEERAFERVLSKMAAHRGDMTFYNCLLKQDGSEEEMAGIAAEENAGAIGSGKQAGQIAEWKLLSTSTR